VNKPNPNKALFILLIFIFSFLCYNLIAVEYVTSLKHTPKFTGVSCEDDFNVNIHKGKTYEAKVYGSEEDLKKVILRVEDQQLQIKYIHTPFVGIQFNKILRVEVTMPELESVAMQGSGSIKTKDRFDNPSLSISDAGSGLIVLTSVYSNQINIDIAGSGSIQLNGYSSKMELALAGSGVFQGEKFKVDEAEISIAGSGEVRTFVNKTLNATILGSGSIYYLGNPTVNKVITGSGDIAPLKRK
jgi:hypothetical protein